MIKMKTIIVFMLSILIYPPSTTQDAKEVKKNVICNIAGSMLNTTYKFDIKILPERCGVINYGSYDLGGKGIVEADKSAIKQLTDASRTVYTRVGFTKDEFPDWRSIFEPGNEKTFEDKIINPMVNALKDSKINGIIIQIFDLYDLQLDNLGEKFKQFVCKIKGKLNNLIVGLLFSGYYYQDFTNDDVFNFKKTNDMMDLYVIDMSRLNICELDLSKTDENPVTSSKDLFTIKMVTDQVKSSSMDQSKIFAMIQTSADIRGKPEENFNHRPTTYSIYCSSADKSNPSKYCANTAKIFHDQGAFVKKSYDGIVLEQLDGDDYEGTCKCGKFPTTNAVLDGWTGSPLKDCPALN